MKIDKLVGEIADRICDVCDVNEYAVPLEEPIKWAITHIGKAVLSGEYPDLDKSLGVVGRFSVVGADKTVLAWIESIREEHPEIKFVPDLIALRPQAAPGEEE